MAAPGELQWSCSPTPLGQQDQIQVLCQQLVDYLTMIMDPSSSQEIRNAYTKSIEEFKEENPHCLVCGFHLASDWPSPQVKHFGLQLVEHYIRFRWTKIQVIEQQEFQQTLLEYLSKQSDQEPVYVKEALARVTVELAKQMWPQRWGSFINDMDTLAKYGHSQVELVLLIFRRLAEDIHIFESDLPSKRKKEMSAALSENISDIFAFLIQNLEFPPSSSDHLRSVALSTITSFADWVDFKTLFMHECKLLKLLYTFIGIEDLKTPSCECLLNIVSRKTDIKRTADERMNLLALLSQEALDGILKASVYANSQGVVEEQYVFLKRVCQLLVHLGISQLAPLWQNKANFQRPETFELYLSVVLEFTNHGSQLLSFTSADVWTSFISHNLIKEDPVFKQFLPKLLAVARQKLFKLGDPTVEDHISSQYSSLDFDGLSEYTQFFSKYRGSMTRIIHQLSLMMPRTVAEEACVATQDLILRTSKKLENAEVHFGFTKNSMDYIEWDGLVSYLETWTGTFKIESSLKEIDDVKQKCLAILNLLLNFTTMDPLILQCQFKCLQSGLINFLHLNPEVFNTYVKKVFSCVKYLGEASEKHHLSQEARAARNQVVVCFVHLCDAQPNLLAPYLELLYSEFQALIDNDSLLYGEKCEFIEGLYTLCQMQLDLKQQQDFIGRLLQEVNQLSLELQGTVTSVPQLISYLGLDKDPSDPEYSLRPRALICYIAHAISLILRKAKTCNELGLELPINHPTYACIMPLLSKISIPLIQCLYQFWSCSFNNLLSKHFQSVTTFHLFEKDTILGRTVYPRLESVEFGEVDHVQMNFVAVHEHCLQALARVFAVYGSKHLYEIQFANEVYKIVVLWITNLNPWRLRSFIRHFMSVLVVSCSEHSWTNILVPFINKTCEHIYSVLKKRWDILAKQRAETNVENLYDHSRNMESEEVFQEQLTIHLSREFSNLLEVICCQRVVTAGRKGKQRIASDDVFMTESQDEMMADAQALDSEQWSLFEVLTPLAEKIIQDPSVRELLFICSFQGMVWDDSHTSNKCTSVAGLLFTKMPSGFFTPDMYTTLFLQVLGALQLHGAHDHVRNQLSFLALLIYQSALKICPQLHQILLKVPKIDPGKITAFDKLLEQDPAPSVKIKKEKFRDLLSGLVKFSDEESRRKVTFDLPEMQFKRKEKSGPILTDLSILFENDDNIASRSMSM